MSTLLFKLANSAAFLIYYVSKNRQLSLCPVPVTKFDTFWPTVQADFWLMYA